MEGKKEEGAQGKTREFSDDEDHARDKTPPPTASKESSGGPPKESIKQPSNRTICIELDKNNLIHILGLAVAAFAIGMPVGYFVRGDCGQGRFDRIDTDLQKFLRETLKPNMETTLRDINADLKTLYTKQKETLDALGTSLRKSDTKIKESMSEISQSTKNLNHGLEEMNAKLVSLENEIKEMKSKLTAITTDIKSNQEQLGESTTAFATKSTEVVREIEKSSGETTQAMAKIASDTIDEIISESTKYNSNLQRSATNVEEMIEKVDAKMQDFHKVVAEVSKQQVDLTSVVSKTARTGTALETAKTELEGQVGNLKKWEDKLCADGKTEAKQDYVGWGLDIFQIIMILIVYLAVTNSRRDNAGTSTAPQGVMAARQRQRVSPGLGASPGPRRLPPTGPVRYEVTVVTFTQETYDQARRVFPEMLGQAWPAAGKVEYKMLTGELDLSQIPSSRGYIVVIGYDARNSILEDMDGSMGSRKRQTIVGLQNTKRDVLVIYIDSDHQIEEPPESVLYNTHLDRPTSHPILRPLVDAQRFLSLRHWKGTRLQAAHLEKWVRALR